MVKALYEKWLKNATEDKGIANELKAIGENEKEIYERFYKRLEFGTGGLRGIMGAGTNRINVYVIGAVTQGLSDYLNKTTKNPSVAISYDSRLNSRYFAETAARVLAGNGIKAYIYSELMPTPALSFAVRNLKCDAGIMITASHNSYEYNGYKCYDATGCQLDPEFSRCVLEFTEKVDMFKNVKSIDFNKGLENGIIEYISQSVIDAYLLNVSKQSVNPYVFEKANLNILYSPIHGAGNKPVRTILAKMGIKNLRVVESQELPDGNFPTVRFPNPEFSEAFDEAKKLTAHYPADLIIATDPDSDRVGVAVKHNDEYVLLSGNEIGVLLLNYILSSRKANGTLPENAVVVKTIVTSNLTKRIADKYGCELIEVLTGFKYIGNTITALEENNESNRFVLGFEESYGYLAGDHVRDKDAVVASMLITEMASYYHLEGKSLIDVMNSIYSEFGFFKDKQVSFTFKGSEGAKKIKSTMENLRGSSFAEIAGIKITAINDYLSSQKTNLEKKVSSKIDLPTSDVLCFELQNGSSVTVRPSGTEPKIKFYISSVEESEQKANELLEKIIEDIKKKSCVEE